MFSGASAASTVLWVPLQRWDCSRGARSCYAPLVPVSRKRPHRASVYIDTCCHFGNNGGPQSDQNQASRARDLFQNLTKRIGRFAVALKTRSRGTPSKEPQTHEKAQNQATETPVESPEVSRIFTQVSGEDSWNTNAPELAHGTAEAFVRALCAYGLARDIVEQIALQPVPATWPSALEYLAAFGCTPTNLQALLERDMKSLEVETAKQLGAAVQQISSASSITAAECWNLLMDPMIPLEVWCSIPENQSEQLRQLRRFGLDTAQLVRLLLLEQAQRRLCDCQQLETMLTFLVQNPPQGCGFEPSSDILRRLFPRAPWLLTDFPMETAAAAVQHLCSCLELNFAPYIRQIVYAHPEILRTDTGQMQAIEEFLNASIQLSSKSIAAMVRSYPRCLTLSLTQVERVTEFLRDLGLTTDDLNKAYRAFPALLALDIDRNAMPVVALLRDWGIADVATMVRGLPPLLVYDIHTDIQPKLKFLRSVMNMDTKKVLEFPAVFSYSLRDRIAPRLLYLRRLGIDVSRMRLSVVIAPSDVDFCRRVARTSMQNFSAFKEEFNQLIEKRLQQVASQQRLSTEHSDVMASAARQSDAKPH
ncbi:hypothetical protein, conserved [Cyanidioschyzon merolae strain 10D]|uniref:Uncharacterized protein n=1 Tax=Cyanidioschyzon merolae (strain NIES-3377 / 10D) TaxID=280699 RepID=M1UXX7_CYAM1|nr:hypothetical protein, conserved [Cyanidioschyzon merolae strain 10D]BAM83401.1 hypothetical protein, conserved [Cyanidioschyzon merolae strain 10D]|eukprot:XP_005539437.1 hypothetical protein, conserved [Cyanidioschyzon merolae strain 10D]